MRLSCPLYYFDLWTVDESFTMGFTLSLSSSTDSQLFALILTGDKLL